MQFTLLILVLVTIPVSLWIFTGKFDGGMAAFVGYLSACISSLLLIILIAVSLDEAITSSGAEAGDLLYAYTHPVDPLIASLFGIVILAYLIFATDLIVTARRANRLVSTQAKA